MFCEKNVLQTKKALLDSFFNCNIFVKAGRGFFNKN